MARLFLDQFTDFMHIALGQQLAVIQNENAMGSCPPLR
jgi:hypothetical protein